LAVRVRVTGDPDATVADETETRDCDNEIAPGVTVKVGRVDVTAEPPIFAPIVVAEPAVVPVKVAV
jgi:hypothetical protein